VSAANVLNLKFAGLYNSPNPFSTAPEGSMEIADNVWMPYANVVEPRRGYQSGDAASVQDTVLRLAYYQTQFMVLDSAGNFLLVDPTLSKAGGYTPDGVLNVNDLTATTPFSPPDSETPYRFAHSAESFFFTTSNGVMKIDGIGNYTEVSGGATVTLARSAGFPVPETPEDASATVTGASDWLADGASVRYRVVFGYTDGFGRQVLSAPSAPVIVTNDTGFTGTPGVTVLLPKGGFPSELTYTPTAQLATQVFFQLYRSVSAASGDDPSDELFLVYQKSLSGISPTVHTWSVTDITPDDYCSGSLPLYTNANTGVGIDSSNDQPPSAKEICAFRTFMLYANTTAKHSLSLSLIGTGSPNGLQSGDIFTIGSDSGVSVAFTAGASENVFARQFQVTTSSTAALNIEATARSLCYVVSDWFRNYYDTAGIPVTKLRAVYASDTGDAPGMLYLQEDGIGGEAFYVTVSAHGSTAWSPPLASATGTYSDNERRPARIYYSREGLPEAVPAGVNFFDVGDADDEILRVLVVRETAFIFKKRGGVYTLTGSGPDSFSVQPFDPTVKLIAAETAVALKNSIFLLADRGVLALNESGTSEIASTAADVELQRIMAQCPNYPSAAFAVGYEKDGLYVLALPSSATDTTCSQQFVFNLANPSWSRWTIPGISHGIQCPDTGSLFLGAGTDIWYERKDFASSDYIDPNDTPIECSVKMLPISAGDPLTDKKWHGVVAYFRDAEFSTCNFLFDSDRPTSQVSTTKSGPTPATWGSFSWGEAPWGTPSSKFILRCDIPQAQAVSCTLGVQLDFSVDETPFQLVGLRLAYEPSSEFVRR
jgi:hypothetical protein